MRRSFRSLLYTTLAFYLVQLFTGIIEFEENAFKSALVFCLSLSLVLVVLKPLLKLAGLHLNGVFYHGLTLTTVTLTLLALSLALPNTSFGSYFVPKVGVSGIILGGFEVAGYASIIFAGFSVWLIYTALNLLGE